MIDARGHLSLKNATDADLRQHEDVALVGRLVELLAEVGLDAADLSLDELRACGLSDDAIVLVVNGTPEELRSVLGRTAAFCVKHGNPFGPR